MFFFIITILYLAQYTWSTSLFVNKQNILYSKYEVNHYLSLANNPQFRELLTIKFNLFDLNEINKILERISIDQRYIFFFKS